MVNVISHSCPRCNSHSLYEYAKEKIGNQKYQCRNCLHQFAPVTQKNILTNIRLVPFAESTSKTALPAAIFTGSPLAIDGVRKEHLRNTHNNIASVLQTYHVFHEKIMTVKK